MKTFTLLKSLNKKYFKYNFFTIMLLLLYADSFAQKVGLNPPSLRPPQWSASHELLHTTDDFGLNVLKRVPILFTNPDTTRVGIGISVPQAKLDVNGAIMARGNISGFNLSLTGNINANSLSLTDGITATNLSLSNNLTTKNLSVTGILIAVNGNFSGNISGNTLTTNTASFGSINANLLSINDDITATNLSLSNNLTTNNLTVTGNFSASNLSLTGNINANSLSLTDGITATNLSLSNNLTTNNLTVTGNFSALNLNLSGSISVANVNITNSLSTTGNIVSTNGIIKSGNSVWLDGSKNAVYSSGTLSLLSGSGLDGNTKVGIGTKTPQKALHIYSEHEGTGGIGGSHYGMRLDYHESATNKTSSWDIEPKFSDKGANSILSFKDVISNKYLLTLADNDSININGQTNIVGNLSIWGNVGIGTTTPNAPLHITGTGDQYIDINSQSGTGNSYTRLMAVSSNNITESQLQYQGRFSFVEPLSGIIKMVIDENDNVGIGTTSPSYKLDVCGSIRAKGIKINVDWCDFVFDKNYNLRTIPQLKTFIEQNGHLPNYPSGKEIEEQGGIEVSQSITWLLQSDEETKLYLIQMYEEMQQLKKENEVMKKQIEELQK